MPSDSEQEDLELQAGARKLARMALNEGFRILENGRPQDKITLIKQLVTPMMRQLGAEDDGASSLERIRQDFDGLLNSVRVQESLPAIAPAAFDRDQELPDDAPGAELGTERVPGSYGEPRA